MYRLIDEKSLSKLLPLNKEIEEWCSLLNEMLFEYSIDTPERIAAFIAQCSHESSQFRILEENLNYSDTALTKIFGKYFADKDVSEYARQPEKIANVIYANRMGNGDTESGDGYRFRGRGVIQLTGRDNYTRFGKYVGMTPEEVIDYLSTKRGALHSAIWFWNSRDLSDLADIQDIKRITKKINGGYIGLTERIENYECALTLLGVEPISHDDCEIVSSLREGTKGKEVSCIQKLLGVTVDGHFGEETSEAVIMFQVQNDLVPDGIVGPNTYSRMKKLLS